MTQTQLAEASNVGLNTVKRFEAGDGLRNAQAQAIVAALERAGALFVSGGTQLDGVPVSGGVARREDATWPRPPKGPAGEAIESQGA